MMTEQTDYWTWGKDGFLFRSSRAKGDVDAYSISPFSLFLVQLHSVDSPCGLQIKWF
jgi:hypothetical protein